VIMFLAAAKGNDLASSCLRLLRITRWAIASVFSANMLRPGFVCRLFLPFLI